jgi:3-deoxy-7-phosphoheptulonate synthase
MSATISELLLAASICWRGQSARDPVRARRARLRSATRNIFDLSAIPLVHKLSHLPIIADPSHGVGLREHVPAMARAAVAAGADGLIIEVHPTPDRALSDGAQSLYTDQFGKLNARGLGHRRSHRAAGSAHPGAGTAGIAAG